MATNPSIEWRLGGWGRDRGRRYADPVEFQDSYTGHVEPGGPAARRVLDELTINKVSVGPHDNNAYLLVCNKTREALLIDAAADPERLSDLIGHDQDRP